MGSCFSSPPPLQRNLLPSFGSAVKDPPLYPLAATPFRLNSREARNGAVRSFSPSPQKSLLLRVVLRPPLSCGEDQPHFLPFFATGFLAGLDHSARFSPPCNTGIPFRLRSPPPPLRCGSPSPFLATSGPPSAFLLTFDVTKLLFSCSRKYFPFSVAHNVNPFLTRKPFLPSGRIRSFTPASSLHTWRHLPKQRDGEPSLSRPGCPATLPQIVNKRHEPFFLFLMFVPD